MTARTCGGRTPSALVLGAGISGLTSALALVERGFRVTIVAERVSLDIVSAVAGVPWEWPPAVCGQHDDVRSLERSKRWCVESYREGFRHDAALVRENQVSPGSGAVDVYSFRAPTIDTEAYLQWLLDRVRRAGCVLVTRRISGCLSERAAELRASYGADVVVNCSGLVAARKTNVRLEPESENRVVHNYGHGGSGVTLSWGRAREAAGLAAELA